MSPLWTATKTNSKKLLTNQKRPSPNHSDCQKIAHKKIKSNHITRYIEEISLFISPDKELTAGMTVEASMVLPLFLFFFLNLGCAIELIRFHCNLEFALFDVGNRLALYGCISEQEEKSTDSLFAELGDIALSYTYIKNELLEYVGRDYVEQAPVVGGKEGLWFTESEILGNDDCLEIVVTYRAKPFMEIPGFSGFRMANRYYAHLWTGYEISQEEEDFVYVAENGVVYHEDENCTHLFLSIKEVTLWEARDSYNNRGEKYDPCLLCGEELQEAWFRQSVYIAEEGEGIHCRRDCQGLKRTIYIYHREDVEKYPPCSRCAGK